MKKDAVLVVGKGIVDLLVPDDAAAGGLYQSQFPPEEGRVKTYRNVYQLNPEGVAHQVVGEHSSTLQPRVGPLMLLWVGNIELRNGHGVDLVVLLGHGALDRLLILVGQNRWHRGWVRSER